MAPHNYQSYLHAEQQGNDLGLKIKYCWYWSLHGYLQCVVCCTQSSFLYVNFCHLKVTLYQAAT